jgi:hypothetical protein
MLAQFLARAFGELPLLPPQSVIEELLIEIFSSLTSARFEQAPTYQRLAVEDAVYAIADRAPDEVLRALSALLRTQPAPVTCEVASWLAFKHWRAGDLIDALRDALIKDDPERDYPISSAFRQALTEVAQQAEYPKFEAQRPRSVATEDPNTLEALLEKSSSNYSRARWRAKVLRARIGDRARRWRVDEAFGKLPAAYQAFEGVMRFAALAETNLAWRAVACGLFGGFGDRDAWRGVHEYYRFARFLQEENLIREQMVDDDILLVQQFGAEDPIYGAAVMLDTRGAELGRNAHLTPRMDLRAAYPIGAVPARMAEEGARAAQAPATKLLAVARASKSPEEAAMLFLAAFLADTEASLDVGSEIDRLAPPVRHALKASVARGRAASADGAYRAAMTVARLGASAAGQSPAKDFAVLLALDTAARISPERPIAPDGDVFTMSPRGRAEAWVYRLSLLQADDLVPRAAEALDAAEALEPLEILQALQCWPEAASAIWAAAAQGKRFEAPWPLSPREPLAALDMIAALPSDKSHTAIVHALPLILLRKLCRDGDKQCRAALLPFASRLLTPLRELSEFGALSDEAIAASVEKVADPYLKCLGLIGLKARGLPVEDTAIARLAKRVRMPEERFSVFDRLIAMSDTRDYLGDAAGAAQRIRDPQQRWRAYVRLAVKTTKRRRQFLRQAAAALESIRDPSERAGAWRAARVSVAGSAFHLAGARVRSRPGASADVRRASAAARGFFAPWLLALEGLGEDDGVITRDAALALYVARTFQDLSEAIAAEHEDVDDEPRELKIQRLAARNDTRGLEALVADFQRERPELTPPLARAILQVALHDGESAQALATALTINPQNLPVDAWYSSPSLAPHAALIIAGHSRRRGAAEIEWLLKALAGPDEVLATRAWEVLSRGSTDYRRPPVLLSSREVGLDGLLAAGAYLADRKKPSSVAAFCFLADVSFDDAHLARQICDLGARENADGDAAREIIRSIAALDADVLTVFQDVFARAPAALQHAILVACANIYICDVDFFRLQITDWLEGVAGEIDTPILFFVNGVADMVSAADEVLTRNIAEMKYLPSQLTALCLQRRVDLRRLIGEIGAADAMKAFSGALSLENDLSPFQSSRQELATLRERHGSQAVLLFAHWLGGVLAQTEILDRPWHQGADVFDLGIFAASELCLRNPSLFSRAAQEAAGDEAGLARGLALSIAKRKKSSIASCISLACATNSLTADVIEAILTTARQPDWRLLERIEQSLEFADRIKSDAQPVLEAALRGSSPRAAFVATRMLGHVARDARAEATLREQAIALLRQVAEGPLGQRKVFVASTRGVDGALRYRTSLRDAAQRELRLTEIV